MCNMKATRWSGGVVGVVPWPWTATLLRPVGTPDSSMLRNELKWPCQNDGIRPLSKQMPINVFAWAVGSNVPPRLSQMDFRRLSSDLAHSVMASL